jgi:glycosyltransferase involved in cell wall biosynthesis
LGNLLQIPSERYVVCNGSYGPVIKKNSKSSNIINLLYSGTFDTTKGGVYAAIESMRYLGPQYILTICGFGNKEQCDMVLNLIREMNRDLKRDSIIYKGFVPGDSDEYTAILNSTDIGLALQSPEGAYNQSSFPSKIVEYLRYGICVVSSDIAVVRQSELGGLINYVEEYSAENIARTIMRCELDFNANEKDLIAIENIFLSKLNKLFNEAI